MTTEYTPNFRFNLPDFRMGPWHDLVNGNTTRIDQIFLALYQGVDTAPWENNKLYSSGQTAIDLTDNSFWVCAFGHTSAPAPTTFAQDRVAHPTYWVRTVVGITPRGQWENATHYLVNDMVSDPAQGVIAVCTQEHDSILAPGTIRDDEAYWTFIVDMSGDTANQAVFVTYDNTTSGAAGTDLQTTTDDLYAKDAIQDAAIAAGQAGIIDHETRIDTLESSDVSQGAAIGTLQNNDITHDTRLTTLESSDAAHETRIDNLETSDTTQQAAIVSLQNAALEHDTRIADNETAVAAHETRIDNLETDVANDVEEAPIDGLQYARKDAGWIEVEASAGGSVSSVFSRTGTVVAQPNDYTFAQIGSKPTTLGGYGITDTLTNTVFGRSGIVDAQTNDYTFAQIGSKPTTLAGYGITDAQPALGYTPVSIAGGQDLTGGFTFTPNNIGTFAASYTPDPLLGNYQYGTRNSSITWNAPASDCAMDVLVTNGATAGAITFSGYTVAAGNVGDALTTTNGHRFIISIRRIAGISTYVIKALQ